MGYYRVDPAERDVNQPVPEDLGTPTGNCGLQRIQSFRLSSPMRSVVYA